MRSLFVGCALCALLGALSLARGDARESCEGPECDKDFQAKWRLPPRVDGVKVGHERELEIFSGVKTVVRTISMKPPIFEIPNFITPEECDHLISYAKTLGLRRSPLIRESENIDDETSKRTFDIWDENSDGFISPREVQNLPGKSDLYFTDDDILEMFRELGMDSDGNRLIDFEEFQRVTVPAVKNYFNEMRKTVLRLWSRNSDQAWMFHDEPRYPLLSDFHGRLSKLTGLPEQIVRHSEPVQAVRYDVHGHYHCHHDSDALSPKLPCCTMALEEDCRLCRYITVLMFLNEPEDGGNTAFPVADNTTYSDESWRLEATEKCNLAKYCDKSNVQVTPTIGKAIMWYNHFRDPDTEWLGQLDPMTYHGGCDVTRGTKWVANIWLNIVGEPGTDQAFQGWRHLDDEANKEDSKEGKQEPEKETRERRKPDRNEAYDVKEEL